MKVEVAVLRSQFLILSPDVLCGRKATLTQLGVTYVKGRGDGFRVNGFDTRYNNK